MTEQYQHLRLSLVMPNSYGSSITLPLAAIITNSNDGNHQVTFASDAFLASTGFERGFVMGSALGDLLRATVDSETASAISEAMLGGADRSWQAMCRRADGSEYFATIILDVVEGGESDASRHLISILAVDAPAPHRLVEYNALHAMYDSAPGFIAMAEGPKHRFTYANPSYLQLIGRRTAVGFTVKELLPEVVDQGIVAILDQVYRTGSPFVATRLPMRLGREGSTTPELRFLNFVYQAVRNIDGKITGIFCEGYDVTLEKVAADDLISLQAEVAHSSRVNAMGMMAATIAHEINQPLAAIASFAAGSTRLLESDKAHVSEFADALLAIEEAAQRAGNIVRNVRELTKRGDTPKATFELRPVVEESIRLVHAGSCTGVLVENGIPDEVRVFGDRTQIQQVLINLIRNACDAMEHSERGAVTVECKKRTGKSSDEIVVAVTDSGRGLSAGAMERLFTWTDSSKHSGMGLGLAISRNIIENHNGDIWVSRSNEFGTQFCFSLPEIAVT